jgi:hypothetical protein
LVALLRLLLLAACGAGLEALAQRDGRDPHRPGGVVDRQRAGHRRFATDGAWAE